MTDRLIILKRHPCEVTADRLREHAMAYRPTASTAAAIEQVRSWLLDTAQERTATGRR